MNEHDQRLTAALQYTFKDDRLLALALTHRSAAFEAARRRTSPPAHNERLEFLGDSVLSMVVSEALFHRCPQASEGELTRMRAAIVNEACLAETAARLGIGEALRLGRGEERTGGRSKTSLLADTLEAVFAAVFLDAGGIDRAREVILQHLAETIERVTQGSETHRDDKTRLQEILQAQRNVTPTYEVVGTEGPDHDRVWHVEVHGGAIRARGQGRSKKAAEQDAAGNALRLLEEAQGSSLPTPTNESPDE